MNYVANELNRIEHQHNSLVSECFEILQAERQKDAVKLAEVPSETATQLYKDGLVKTQKQLKRKFEIIFSEAIDRSEEDQAEFMRLFYLGDFEAMNQLFTKWVIAADWVEADDMADEIEQSRMEDAHEAQNSQRMFPRNND